MRVKMAEMRTRAIDEIDKGGESEDGEDEDEVGHGEGEGEEDEAW